MEVKNYTDYYSVLDEAKIDLEMFSSLPPNTWIQRHRENNSWGHFKPVAGTYSSFFGAQYLSSFVEKYDVTSFFWDFDLFCGRIREAVLEIYDHGSKLGNNSSEITLKNKHFRVLQSIKLDLNHALGDEEKKTGLYGLLETHKCDSIFNKLKRAIQYLTTCVEQNASYSQKWCLEDFTQSQFQGTSSKLDFCLEASYTDEKWEQEIELSHHFIIESTKIQKYAQYSATMVCEQAVNTYNEVKNWNEIMNFPNGAKLHLGSIPLIVGGFGYEVRNDLETIKKMGVKSVLSGIEKFENHTEGYIISPVTCQNWKDAGIKQLQIPTPDRKPLTLEKLQRGVEFIHWNLIYGRDILVHCKLGKSRSASMVMGYLIKYCNMTADEAYRYVHSIRLQASFDEERKQILRTFENKCRQSGFNQNYWAPKEFDFGSWANERL